MKDGKRLYDKYFDSTYNRVNILTRDQLDKSSDDFAAVYGKYLPDARDASILDAGCGAGQFLYFLKKEGYSDYMGVDISAQQVRYCRENITDRVEEADLREKLNTENQYDAIVANDVLEHIPKGDVIFLLGKVREALKPGGVFISRVPNMSNPLSLESRYCDFTHEVGFTGRSLYQALYTSGFEDIEILPPRNIPIRSVRNLMRKWMISTLHRLMRFAYYVQDYTVPENLDKNIIAVARKK